MRFMMIVPMFALTLMMTGCYTPGAADADPVRVAAGVQARAATRHATL